MHLSLQLAWLEDALERPGCPICALRLGHERDWLEIFMYDHSGDPGIAHMLSESRGFCHRHAWAIAHDDERKGPLVQVLTYERLVRRLLAPSRRSGRLVARRGARARRHHLWAVSPGHRCPACLAVARTDGIYARVFGRSLVSDAFLARYARSEGLCLAHLNQVLAASPAPARASLLQAHIARLEAATKAFAPGAYTGPWPEQQAQLGLSLLVGADPYSLDVGDRRPVPATGWCKVCTLERDAEARGVATAAGDPVALPAGAWLCARHAWQAFRLAEAGHSGGGFQDWLRAGLEAAVGECAVRVARLVSAETGRPEGSEVAHADGNGLGVRDCVVCSTVEVAVREHITAAPDALPVGGVCLRHLATYPPTTRTVADQHEQAVAARLQALAADLDEFIRKTSWHCRHEPKGAEQDSWRRAISLFVGDA